VCVCECVYMMCVSVYVSVCMGCVRGVYMVCVSVCVCVWCVYMVCVVYMWEFIYGVHVFVVCI